MSNIRCHKCGENAAIRMRQHRLALCKPHYLEWCLAQTERFIEKYHMFRRDERIVVAVSGGKDSLSLWDVLWRLGYQVDGLYIHLGITTSVDYSNQSEDYSRRFAAERGLHLHIVNVKDTYGESVPELSWRANRGRGRMCSVCGLVKRHIMNQVTQQAGYDVIATGHNLDDEAAVLFGNTFNWQSDLLLRQAPVLAEAPGLARKVKPFCRFYERESAAYALLRKIPYIYDECPFAHGNTSLYYKTLLNQMEVEQPGAKLRFYVGFLKARKTGLFAMPEENIPEEDERRCTNCGQPTTSEGLCAFCKLLVKR